MEKEPSNHKNNVDVLVAMLCFRHIRNRSGTCFYCVLFTRQQLVTSLYCSCSIRHIAPTALPGDFTRFTMYGMHVRSFHAKGKQVS